MVAAVAAVIAAVATAVAAVVAAMSAGAAAVAAVVTVAVTAALSRLPRKRRSCIYLLDKRCLQMVKDPLLSLFGQRPRRGRCPIQLGEICAYVRPFDPPPGKPSGSPAGFLGLKPGLWGVQPGLRGFQPGLRGIQAGLRGF